MEIVFAISDSYSQHCCVAMASILCNNPGREIHFHILSDNIADANKQKFAALSKLGTKYDIYYHNIPLTRFENFSEMLGRITLHGYYRYVIADILPETNKCLYLDADLVVNGPLDKLWETDMEGYYCAGAVDIGIRDAHKEKLNLGDYPYINSGVLLLNLDMIRKDNMIPKLFEKTSEISSYMKYLDQDAINYVFRGKILVLPQIWNFMKADSLAHPELCKEAVIIHYTEDRKPWLPDYYSRHTMRRLYFRYLKMTPYSRFISGFRVKRIIHKVTKPFEPLFRIGRDNKKH